jgi:hypothetical protein
MKKTTPIFFAGILFVVAFLGLIQISKLSGLWVVREGHGGYGEGEGRGRFEDGEGHGRFGERENRNAGMTPGKENQEEKNENGIPVIDPNHFGTMSFADFCQMFGINRDCALQNLGIEQGKLENTLSSIAQSKSTTVGQIIKTIQSCQSDYDESGIEEGGDR